MSLANTVHPPALLACVVGLLLHAVRLGGPTLRFTSWNSIALSVIGITRKPLRSMLSVPICVIVLPFKLSDFSLRSLKRAEESEYWTCTGHKLQLLANKFTTLT